MSCTSNTQKKTYICPTICVSFIEDTFMICQTTQSLRIKSGTANNSTCFSKERNSEVSDESIGFGALWE
jgi:hypothetical protein